MLVSHSHRFVYLKTHKAAGSSIYRLLERFCAPPAFLESSARATSAVHISAHGVWARLVDSQPTTYRPHGQHGLQDHSQLQILHAMLPEAFHRYHKIAAIRHPYDKVASAFFFRLWNSYQKAPRENPLAAQLSRAELTARFSAYVTPQPIVSTGRNDYRYFFYQDRFCVDSVLRYEHLHADLQALNERLGLGLDVRASLPHDKRRIQDRAGLRYRDFITPAAKAAIDAHYDWYFDQFGYERVFPDEADSVNPSSSAQPAARAR